MALTSFFERRVHPSGSLRYAAYAASLRPPGTPTPFLLLVRLLAIRPQKQLFRVLRAFELQELHIFLETSIERHADLPWSRKDLRILDQSFVRQVIRAEWGKSFDHMQGIAVEIPGPVEPVLARWPLRREQNGCRESRHIDNQRIALPFAVGPAHPGIDGRLRWFPHIDLAASVGILIDDRQPLLTLTDTGKDLEWIRQIRSAGHTGQMTFQFRIELQAVLVVFLFLFRGPLLIRNPSAFDDAQAWRRCADRAELENRRRSAALAFEVPVCRVEGLPDAAQVRLAVRETSYLGLQLVRAECGLPGRRLSRRRCDGEQNDEREFQRISHRIVSLASLYSVERKIVGSRNFHLALSKEQVQHEDTIGSFIRPARAIVVDRLRLTQLRSDGRFSRSDEAA